MDFEKNLTMTDTEADFETLSDIQDNIGQFAVFVDMIQQGDSNEI